MRSISLVTISWDKPSRAYLLETAVTLPATGDSLFEFFSDAFQLEQITPPWLNFRVLTPAPIAIEPGTLIDYRLKLHGLPIRWRTEISTWNPPESFTDRQLKGPYYLWEHLHTFEAGEAGTIVRDQVRYRVPGGAIIHWLFVKSELLRIFEYRMQRMQEIFSESQPTGARDRADSVRA